MIHFQDVDVDGDGNAAILRDITLSIGERRVGVIGANGSGKTTLARLVNGLGLPTRGKVSVDGHDTRDERSTVQRRVGFVFQDADHQLVYPTPVEDLALGLRARGTAKRQAEEKAREMLRGLQLERVADQAVHTLSGGEKQLVALAGVLVLSPAWVVLDEPTAALDLANRRRVIDALEAMQPGALIVSHDLDHVRTFDRAILVEEGQIVADGDPGDVVATYAARYA